MIVIMCVLEIYREQLGRKDVELRNKGIITGPGVQEDLAAGSAVLGAGRIAHLEAELRQAGVGGHILTTLFTSF